MTLIFKGHKFKYELEAIVKLFIPVLHFEFVYDGTCDGAEGDYCFAKRTVCGDTAELSVSCRIGDKTEMVNETIPVSTENFDGRCEMRLSAMLFGALQKLTGKTADWGILTGVRPVKRVNSMLAAGKTKDDIFSELKESFLCSDKKCSIAYETAVTQQKVIGNLDERSFSLYVSIPFCPSRCSYCSFVSQEVEKSLKLIPQYIFRLCREIEATGELAKRLGLKLDTVYFGGGTPTSLEAAQLEAIMKTVEKSFDCSALREYTVEAGRADTITEEKLRVIKNCGAKRISINPQTLSNSVLKAIGRRHTAEDFYEKFDLARKVGFDCINTDLIAGLPTDTVESFKNTIDGIVKLSPENVTVHTLSIKRCATINTAESRDVLRNPAAEMVDYATETLQKSAYSPYYLYRQKNMLDNLENIGWSKKDCESLYNIYIMEEIQTILAVGAGGSTKLVDNVNHRLERVFNYKLSLEYIKNFDKVLEKKKEIEEFYGCE